VVLEALDRLLASKSQVWPLRCEQAFDILPSEWRLFERRLDIARDPDRFKGRNARKQLRQAQRGFVLAGKLPVQIVSEGEQPADEAEFLCVRP
jgi:hypothetical protein